MTLQPLPDIATIPERKNESRTATDEDKIKKIVSAKIGENDVEGAVKVISGSQWLAPFNDNTFSKLKELHPSQPEDFTLPPPPNDNASQFYAKCTEKQVKAEIKKFLFHH